MQPKLLLFLLLFYLNVQAFLVLLLCFFQKFLFIPSFTYHNHTDKTQTKLCMLLFGNMRKNSITKFTQISKILCAILILI